MTETTFAPNQPLTRAQLMKMLVCFAVDDAAIKAAASAQRFTDVAPGQWYAGHVNWAAEKGVTNGYEDGSFRPNQSVSRADFIQMIQNMQGILVNAPEEIAYRYKMITKEQLVDAARSYGKSNYGKYLMDVAEGKLRK